MNRWKTAAVVAVAVAAAGVGAALAPPAHGQTRVARAQGSRALEVLTGGSRIGVSIRDVEDGDTKNPKGVNAGVLVEEVSTDSPAEKAGIRKGDVIVEFDGERVRSVRQLTRLVQETAPGRTVGAILQRDGQRTTVSVTPRDDSSFSFRGLEDLGDWGREFRYRVAPRAIPARRRRRARPTVPRRRPHRRPPWSGTSTACSAAPAASASRSIRSLRSWPNTSAPRTECSSRPSQTIQWRQRPG